MLSRSHAPAWERGKRGIRIHSLIALLQRFVIENSFAISLLLFES